MSTPAMGTAHARTAGHDQPSDYKRIYVWQLPVRLFHWATAASIVLLCITGFLIGHPLYAFYAPQAYQQYWFGWVRFVHFAAAFVLMTVVSLRLYWAFAGNRYANWRHFFPLTRAQWDDIRELLWVEISLVRKHGRHHMGHNALAGTTYFVMFLAFLFQTATGLALYAGMSDARLTHIFNWIVPLMGGNASVRFWHHAFLWIFVLFIIVHVYLAFYDDYVAGGGEISAMISGWKFKRKKHER